MADVIGKDPFGPPKYSQERGLAKVVRAEPAPPPAPKAIKGEVVADPPTTKKLASPPPSHASLISLAMDDVASRDPLLKDQPAGILPRTQLPSGLYGATGPQILPPTCNVALCAVARRYHPTIADLIKTLKQEVFRKGIEYEPAFTRRCEPCDMDYDTDVEKCELCGAETREPDRKQELALKAWMKSCNDNDQSLQFVMELVEDDINTFDDAFLLLIKDYGIDKQGVIRTQKVTEVVRGLPGRIMLILDEAYQKRGYMVGADGKLIGYFACVLHRDQLYNEQGKCAICGRPLHPCHAVGLDEHGKPTKGYIEGEIIHWSYYVPSEAYGFSPIMTLWTPALTITAMDTEQYFTYANDRPPKLVLAFNTDNPDGLQEQIKKIDEERKVNPNYMPIIGVEKKTEGGGAQVLNLTQSMAELENADQRKDIYTRLYSMYGVEPIFMSDPSSSGGLNNEGRQITVGLRTTETHQSKFHGEVFPPLQEAWKITDYRLKFPDPDEKDKAADTLLRVQNLQMRIQVEMAGGTVTIIDEDTWEFQIDDEPDFSLMGGMGGMGSFGQRGGGGYGSQGGMMGPEGGYGAQDEFQKHDIAAKAIGEERDFYSDLVSQLDAMLKAMLNNLDAYQTPIEQQAVIDQIIQASVGTMEIHTREDMAKALIAGIELAGVDPMDMGLNPDAIREIAFNSPVWETFDKMTEEMSTSIGDIVKDVFLRPQEADVRTLTRKLAQEVGGTRGQLRRIARTELARVQTIGKEMGYTHRDPEGEWVYRWAGKIDNRTCDAHKTLIRETRNNPQPMTTLKGRVHELGREQMGPKWEIIDWMIHPHQRGTMQRVVV